jgi:pimeloyl-ACP methyl ester carboxylesterase
MNGMHPAWLALLLPVLMLVRALRPASADPCTALEDRWLCAGNNLFPPSTKSQWLDLPGIRTHYLVIPQPDAPSMVMLHGTGSTASLAWASSADKLATRFSIYAPDLPAFGRTPLPRTSIDPATPAEVEALYADWLANYIDALELKTPVVVAHSIGAFFAVKFAKKYPTKLSKLILVDPAGLLPTLGRWGIYFAWVFKLGIPTKQLRSLGTAATLVPVFDFQKTSARAFWLQLHASPTAFGDQVVAKFISMTGPSGYWNRPALGDLLTAGVPFAFVYGETDNLMPPAQGRLVVEVAMRDVSAEQMVGIVPGAWHAPFHVQKGEPFVEKVLRAVEVARLPEPSKQLLQNLASLDPSLYASSWNLRTTARAIERFSAALRAAATDPTV